LLLDEKPLSQQLSTSRYVGQDSSRASRQAGTLSGHGFLSVHPFQSETVGEGCLPRCQTVRRFGNMFLDAQLFSVKELRPFSQGDVATLPTEMELSNWEVVFPKRGLPSSPTTQTDPFDPVNSSLCRILFFALIRGYLSK
jgi:hypothetical protein